MKYMMFVIVDPSLEAEPSDQDISIEQWLDEVKDHRIVGEALRPTSTATTVRVSGGEVLVSDGPYTEAKEWIVGFDLLECEDLDQAIKIASRHPQANGGKLELRPIWNLDEE